MVSKSSSGLRWACAPPCVRYAKSPRETSRRCTLPAPHGAQPQALPTAATHRDPAAPITRHPERGLEAGTQAGRNDSSRSSRGHRHRSRGVRARPRSAAYCAASLAWTVRGPRHWRGWSTYFCRGAERQGLRGRHPGGLLPSQHASLDTRWLYRFQVLRQIGAVLRVRAGAEGPRRAEDDRRGGHVGCVPSRWRGRAATLGYTPTPAAFPGGARQVPGSLGWLWRLELQHHALWGGPRAGARCALAVGNPRCSTIALTPPAPFTARQHPPPART